MISVPLTRISGFSEPITRTQQLLYDAHESLRNSQTLFDKTTDLNNHDNIAYTGPLFFGTPRTGSSTSKFIYDTGSPKIVTSSASCTIGCPFNYYNSNGSSTFQYVGPAAPIIYGKGNVDGFIGSDTVCLDNSDDYCATDFDFFIVTSAGDGIFSSAEDIDGILGMSP